MHECDTTDCKATLLSQVFREETTLPLPLPLHTLDFCILYFKINELLTSFWTLLSARKHVYC